MTSVEFERAFLSNILTFIYNICLTFYKIFDIIKVQTQGAVLLQPPGTKQELFLSGGFFVKLEERPGGVGAVV